jgi:hypothetical protein
MHVIYYYQLVQLVVERAATHPQDAGIYYY